MVELEDGAHDVGDVDDAARLTEVPSVRSERLTAIVGGVVDGRILERFGEWVVVPVRAGRTVLVCGVEAQDDARMFTT